MTGSASGAPSKGRVWWGVAAGLLLQIVQWPLALLAGAAIPVKGFGALYVLLFPGATQFVFLAPVMLWLWSTGRKSILKGAWIAASIVILLNAACWGIVAINMG